VLLHACGDTQDGGGAEKAERGGERMKRDRTLSVMLTDEEYLELKRRADKDDRPVSTYVRMMIRQILFGHSSLSESSLQSNSKTVLVQQRPLEGAA
jgi:hypothetical protein